MGATLQIRDVDRRAGGKVEVSAPAPKTPPGSYSLVIKRGATRDPFLGPDGWQQVEHAFPAADYLVKGDRLLLTFGSDVVDNALRTDDVIEISIPEIGLADVVVWTGITRSVDLSDEVAEVGAATPKRDEKKAFVPPPPFPSPHGGTDDDETDGDTDGQDEDTGDVAPPPPPPGPTEGRPWWMIPLVIVALLALGGAGWWFLMRDEVPEVADDPVAPVIVEDEGTDTGETETVTEDTAEIEPVAPAPEVDPAQAAFERGLAAFEAQDCNTARSEMIDARDLDHGPAILFWAENTDSLDFDGCLSDTSNDMQALNRYRQACEAGVEGAGTQLEALEAYLQTRADNGDTVSGEVLRLAMPGVKAACSSE